MDNPGYVGRDEATERRCAVNGENLGTGQADPGLSYTPLARLRTHLPDWVSDRLRSGEQAVEDKLGGPARTRVIVVLACILALDSADKGAVGAMAPQLEAAFHIGNLEIGILSTVSSLVGALATLPMGVLTDRTRRTRLLTISIVIWAAAEAASGLSSSYIMLLLIRLALGAVTATAGPAIGSLTGDLFPAAERSRIYGFILTGELLGSGAGLLVSGDVGAITWRAGFIVLAIPSLALAWVVHRYLPEPVRGGQSHLKRGDEEIVTVDEDAGAGSPTSSSPDGPAPSDGPGRSEEDSAAVAQVRERGISPDPEVVLEGDPTRMGMWEALKWVLKVRTNVLLIISSALGYFFFAGLKTFAVLFARGQYGISQSVATLLAVVVGAAAIVGLLVGGRVADRLLDRGRINARLVVGAAGYLAAAVILIPPLLSHDLALALPLVMLGAAALSAPNAPGDAARLDVVPSRMWGRTEAVRTFLRTLLEAFAPLLFGLVSQLFGSPSGGGFGAGVNNKAAHVSAASAHGLSYAFLVMLIPLGAGGYFLLRARRTYPGDVASAAESEQRTTEAGRSEDDRARSGR